MIIWDVLCGWHSDLLKFATASLGLSGVKTAVYATHVRENSSRTACVCHVIKSALTTMLLVCSSAASCIRLVSWLRYRWFSCRRRGTASLYEHKDSIRSRPHVQFSGVDHLRSGVCVGGASSPVVWSGEGCKRMRGADWLRWLGPLGHRQEVGRLRTGCYRVPRRVLSLKKREKGGDEEETWTHWIDTVRYTCWIIQKPNWGILHFIMHICIDHVQKFTNFGRKKKEKDKIYQK